MFYDHYSEFLSFFIVFFDTTYPEAHAYEVSISNIGMKPIP